MAFDFPASPSNGQEFTPAGGPTFVWQPPIWKMKGTGGGGTATALGQWKFASATTAPAASGEFRLNNASQYDATVLHLSVFTLAGKSVENLLYLQLVEGAKIYVQETASGSFKTWTVSGPLTSASGSISVPVTLYEGAGNFVAGQPADLTILPPAGSGAATYIGDTAPASPTPGMLWWESDSGILFIWYDDGNSQQWVQVSGVGDFNAVPEAPLDGKTYGRVNGAWADITQTLLTGYLPLAGGTVTGITHFDNTLYADADLAVDGLLSEQGHRLVRKDGDTMTGDLTIGSAAPRLNLDKTASGQGTIIYGMTAGKNRWGLQLGSNAAESGGNAGSNLNLYAYDDAGTTPMSVLSVLRSDGLITLTQGRLKFPATANPSTDVNTLDDYREGTWVPTLTFGGASTGIAYTTQTGEYVKVGRMVYIQCDILLSSKGSATGNALITGLPFVGYGLSSAQLAAYYATMASTVSGITGYASSGSIALITPASIAAIFLTEAHFTATSRIRIGGNYMAQS